MLRVDVGVQGDTDHEIWVLDFGQPPGIGAVEEEAAVRKDVEGRVGPDLLAAPDDREEPVPEQGRLSPSDTEFPSVWAHELDQAKKFSNPPHVVDGLRR